MKEREALKLAQRALSNRNAPAKTIYEALHAIKEALAQPEQEPVAWITNNGDGWLRWHRAKDNNSNSIPLYNTPPQRTWVGLTDAEIVDALDVAKVSFKRSQQGVRGQQLTASDSPDWHYAKALEAKLKEKNT